MKIKPETDSKAWKYFISGKLARLSLKFLLLLSLIAIFADFIANEKPIVTKINGELFFPVLKSLGVDMGIASWKPEQQNQSWNEIEYDWIIRTPIPYSPGNLDLLNAQSVGPFDKQQVNSFFYRHWLGTDELGRDVFSGLIHGSRVALFVGLLSILIALIIGVLLGSLAGFFGDTKMKMKRSQVILFSIFVPVGIFWAFSSRWYILQNSLNESFHSFLFELLISFLILSACVISSISISYFSGKSTYLNKEIAIPIDIIISRFIEIINSVPVLFLVISIIAITKPSIMLVVLIIGFTSWTVIAKLIRAEILKIKNLEFMEAVNALGYSNARILWKHVIPNAISPVLIAAAFGVASAIIAESTLSFIGIGVPPETVTWGSLLSSARQSPGSWWLAIFPGLMIFATVTFLNYAGQSLSDAFDPKMRK